MAMNISTLKDLTDPFRKYTRNLVDVHSCRCIGCGPVRGCEVNEAFSENACLLIFVPFVLGLASNFMTSILSNDL